MSQHVYKLFIVDCYFNLPSHVVSWKGELHLCNNGANFGSIFNAFPSVSSKSSCNFFPAGKEHEAGSDRKHKALLNWPGFWDWSVADSGNDSETEHIASVSSVSVYEWIYEQATSCEAKLGTEALSRVNYCDHKRVARGEKIKRLKFCIVVPTIFAWKEQTYVEGGVCVCASAKEGRNGLFCPDLVKRI